MPESILQIALIIIIIRSLYKTFTLSQRFKKQWLDLLYYISIAVVAAGFLFS